MNILLSHSIQLYNNKTEIINGVNIMFDLLSNSETSPYGLYKYFLLLNCCIIIGQIILLACINYIERKTLLCTLKIIII